MFGLEFELVFGLRINIGNIMVSSAIFRVRFSKTIKIKKFTLHVFHFLALYFDKIALLLANQN